MEKIRFRKHGKKGVLRKRKISEEENETEEINKEGYIQTLELRKIRQRASGISAACLNSDLNHADSEVNDLSYSGSQSDIGTQFSKETRIRDEDEEMKKFIEGEMQKKVGNSKNDGSYSQSEYLTPEDRALLSLPKHYLSSSRKNEEMLSSQMLSGIPEIDLGIDEKIRNIEATEAAKKVKSSEKETPSYFVPQNLTVNFGRKSRTEPFKNEGTLKILPSLTGDTNSNEEKDSSKSYYGSTFYSERATDDLHLTKFKKHFGHMKKK